MHAGQHHKSPWVYWSQIKIIQHDCIFFLNLFSCVSAVQYGWAKHACALPACKHISGSRENEGKSIEGEAEGHSLKIDMESKLESGGCKRQGWVVGSMYQKFWGMGEMIARMNEAWISGLEL